jgi:hypothetical protein
MPHIVKRDRNGLIRCRVCRCTELEPCFPPCWWEPGEEDICNRCNEMAYHLRVFMAGAHRFSRKALFREVARREAHEKESLRADARRKRKARRARK